ncbi:MAG: hypothetical protein ACPLSY_03645 [Moorellaceae bacterium]
MGHDRCIRCGRSNLVHHIGEDGLCGYYRFSEWLATVDPKELVGRRVRRNAAWGPTRETYEIVDARRNRHRPAEVMVRLKGYKGWFRLRKLYLV